MRFVENELFGMSFHNFILYSRYSSNCSARLLSRLRNRLLRHKLILRHRLPGQAHSIILLTTTKNVHENVYIVVHVVVYIII